MNFSRALPCAVLLLSLSTAAFAQTVQVSEASSSVVNVYVGGASTPKQVLSESRVTFQDETLSATRVLRTYTAYRVDGEEKLASPATVLIQGKLGSERSYRALSGLTKEVQEHLQTDLKEDRFLPLLETTPAEASSPWEIPLGLASNLLEHSRDSFLSGSRAAGRLKTRIDEGRERAGAEFRFDLRLSETIQSGLRIAEGSQIDAHVRLEPTDAGLIVAFQSTLRGQGLAIHSQALPAGTRIEGTTYFRRDYTRVDAAGAPQARPAGQELGAVFATFLGRSEAATKKSSEKSDGLAGSVRRRHR